MELNQEAILDLIEIRMKFYLERASSHSSDRKYYDLEIAGELRRIRNAVKNEEIIDQDGFMESLTLL